MTETLHGILPIIPEEDSPHYYENTILQEEDLSSSLYGSGTSNTTSQDDGIEVITINPNNVEMEEFDEDDEYMRSFSRSSFRSRTDSSSIGDYESHSSDYDEEDDDEYEAGDIKEDSLLPTGDIMAEDDAFDIDIDGNTFDLATFIIQDDISVMPNNQTKIVIPQKNIAVSEDEDDSDVDIETCEDARPVLIDSVMPEPDIELEEEISVVIKEEKVEEKKRKKKIPTSTKPKNITLVPNKRQRDFLKGKFGLGRGKGLGKGKGISMHKKPPVVSPVKKAPIAEKNMKSIENVPPTLNSPEKEIVRKKLNLDEYKRRRELPITAKPIKLETLTPITNQSKSDDIVKKVLEANNKIAESRSLLLPLNGPAVQPKRLDPITEAKNKVLRLQEMKKAKQIKIIDSTVNSKVKKVTVLPPLQDIINGKCFKETVPQDVVQKNPNYEEIIIVSVSTNTEVTIPPIRIVPKSGQSLLKISNAKVVAPPTTDLLENVSSTIQKVKCVTKSSLICSIQDVVVKKTVPGATIGTVLDTKIVECDKKKDLEHGEDKIIMHLRKDRIRKKKMTASCQTDLLPEFPPLPIPVRRRVNRGRKYRKRGHSSDEEGSRYRKKWKRGSSYSGSSSSSSSSSLSSDSSDSEDGENHRRDSIGRGYRDRSASKERDTSDHFGRRQNHSNVNSSGSPGECCLPCPKKLNEMNYVYLLLLLTN